MISSIATTPTTPVRDRTYWTTVLHNAAKVPVQDPRYDNARTVIGMALDAMQNANDTAADKDIRDISPGKIGTALVGFGHGASLGIAGDKTYLHLARQANPKTAFLSDLAGTAALGSVASPLVAGLSPATGAAVIGGALSAGRGAIEPIPGFNRVESAALMGTAGAATGAVLGKFVSKLGPVIKGIAANVQRLTGFGVTSGELPAITESAIRAQLGKLKIAPDIIERAVQSWKTTGELTVRGMAPPKPTAPTNLRPGESLTPIPDQPRGFAVTGTRATPPVPTAPTLAEMQGFNTTPRLPDIGTGKTLPYYPRGGMVEQALGQPPPVSSPAGPSLAPNQQAAFLSFLKGASPEDAASRVGTLRALGVPLPPTAETDLLALLHGGLLK